MNTEKTKTIAELAVNALQVQDACNLLGVSKAFARELQMLCEELGRQGLPNDTMAVRNHPITRLWASKIHDLAGMGLSDFERYGEAASECERLAYGGPVG